MKRVKLQKVCFFFSSMFMAIAIHAFVSNSLIDFKTLSLNLGIALMLAYVTIIIGE